MSFSDKIEGYEVTLSFWQDKPAFRVEGVGDFDSYDKCVQGIKAYDLSLRKNFSNPTAYYLSRRYSSENKLIEVTVTSVADDKEAWIRTPNGRSKVRLTELFARRDEVEQAMDIEAECDKKTAAAWVAATRWTPQPKAPK